jgi:hypothetical protein
MLPVDVYAIAIILWQLWFKQVPFADKRSFHLIIAFVMSGKRPSLTGAVKGKPVEEEDRSGSSPVIPKVLASLIEACWRQEPKQRPRMASVFASFKDDVESAVQAFVDTNVEVKNKEAPGSPAQELTRPPFLTQHSGHLVGNPSSLTTTTMPTAAFKAFLTDLGLEKFGAKLVALGITDVEMLSDREICDDDSLTKKVGMTKLEIRKMRTIIESAGTGPTMTRMKVAQAASPAAQKKENVKLFFSQQNEDSRDRSGDKSGKSGAQNQAPGTTI